MGPPSGGPILMYGGGSLKPSGVRAADLPAGRVAAERSASDQETPLFQQIEDAARRLLW